MEDRELYLQVLQVARRIIDCGPEIVDMLKVTDKKRLYALIVETFRSFSAYSRLIESNYLVQSSAVLRLFVEQTAKISILVEHQELYDSFSKHCKIRQEIIDMPQKERKQYVLKAFNLNENQYTNALNYLDYGWIKPLSNKGEYGYHTMLKMAFGGEEGSVLKWIDRLDQFIHQNADSFSLTDEGFKLFVLDNIYFGCIAFEHFYVAFHNLTKKEFTFGGVRLFEDCFWPLYTKMLKPGDAIN